MKKIYIFLIYLSIILLSSNTYAANLLEIYLNAKESNPKIKESFSDLNQSIAKIKELRSPLLPQLNIVANAVSNTGYRQDNNKENNTFNTSLKLTQILFNKEKWDKLSIQEKETITLATAYELNKQKLILDISIDYINILKSIDTLSSIEANKKSIYYQLDQTTQRFNAGLTSIIDVQNARANYDTTLANEVLAQNNLSNNIETLNKISGRPYSKIALLDLKKFKITNPQPIETLLIKAKKQNLTLVNSRLFQSLAQDNIMLAKSGHLPAINLSASTTVSNDYFSGSRATKQSDTGNNIRKQEGANSAGIELELPLYSGGATDSRVKQAKYNLQAKNAQLESDYRNINQITYSSYNNLISSISSITAYEQLVISAKTSLEATEAGYEVGTRTIVDVLANITVLYQSKEKLSNARYDYLINQLIIKYNLGELDETDIQNLNSILSEKEFNL